ncbi:hypothetical protein [Azospirillum sp. sgz302134]
MADTRFISPCPPPEGSAREGLTILSEEGSEITEIVGELIAAVSRMQVRNSKCLRFGLDEVQPGQRLSNADRLAGEVGDLMGVVDLLCRMGVLDARRIDDCRTAKVGKLAKFMQSQPAPAGAAQ